MQFTSNKRKMSSSQLRNFFSTNNQLTFGGENANGIKWMFCFLSFLRFHSLKEKRAREVVKKFSINKKERLEITSTSTFQYFNIYEHKLGWSWNLNNHTNSFDKNIWHTFSLFFTTQDFKNYSCYGLVHIQYKKK